MAGSLLKQCLPITVGQFLLLLQHGIDLLLESALSNQSVDHHILVLPYPVCPVSGQGLRSRVPPQVVMDHMAAFSY